MGDQRIRVGLEAVRFSPGPQLRDVGERRLTSILSSGRSFDARLSSSTQVSISSDPVHQLVGTFDRRQ
jgi:hypothetical protein